METKHPVSCYSPDGAFNAHRMKFITNSITCKISIISSIATRTFIVAISPPVKVHLLFRPIKDMSHQRTGPVCFPPRGDMATHQPKPIAEERGDSTR